MRKLWTSKDKSSLIASPVAFDSYPNGGNMYAAYMIPNALDPSGQIKCCKKFVWDSPYGSNYDSYYSCYSDCVSYQTNAGPIGTGVGSTIAGSGAFGSATGLGVGSGLTLSGGAMLGGAAVAGWGVGSLIGCTTACSKTCVDEVPPVTHLGGRGGKCLISSCPSGSTSF